MTGSEIYRDIATRTGGDIYIGVVGPVRTGKSTFIKKFMETVVIPNIPGVSMLISMAGQMMEWKRTISLPTKWTSQGQYLA